MRVELSSQGLVIFEHTSALVHPGSTEEVLDAALRSAGISATGTWTVVEEKEDGWMVLERTTEDGPLMVREGVEK